MAAVKTSHRPTTTRFTGAVGGGTTKSILDLRRLSPAAHVTSRSLHKHEAHSKKAHLPQQQQVSQPPNPRQVLIGKRRPSCTVRQRQEQTSMTSKKTTTQPMRGRVTEVGNPSSRNGVLASDTDTFCFTSDDVRTSQLELSTTRPLAVTWNSAELDSWKSSNDNTDGISGNYSAEFIVTASSTGCDVMSSNSACEAPDLHRRASIHDNDLHLLHLPPICTSSTCLIHVIWDGNNDKYINNDDNINNKDTEDERQELTRYEQTSSRHLIDHSASSRLHLKAVNRSTQLDIIGCSKSALISESGSVLGDLLSIPPKNPETETRRAATKSSRKKSETLRVDREPPSDDTVLRKWKSQQSIELPPLATVGRRTKLRSQLTSAAMIRPRQEEIMSWSSPNNWCDSPTAERILTWLMDVEASGPKERPTTPFVHDDEPTQTDTAIHIIYGEDWRKKTTLELMQHEVRVMLVSTAEYVHSMCFVDMFIIVFYVFDNIPEIPYGYTSAAGQPFVTITGLPCVLSYIAPSSVMVLSVFHAVVCWLVFDVRQLRLRVYSNYKLKIRK